MAIAGLFASHSGLGLVEPFSAVRTQRDEHPARMLDGERLLDVVARCQKCDSVAQRQLYDACHRMVYRLATRMVGCEDATDVSQQVFLQVFRSIEAFNGRSRFETWLYRITVNESLQHLRRARRCKLQALAREPVGWENETNRFEQRELLEHALAEIDPRLRAIFLLREVDDLSYREIADVLDIPEGTVGSRLNRARRELRSSIAIQNLTDDPVTEHRA